VVSEEYAAGDFHQHTTFTDGSYSLNDQMEKNNPSGFDGWANSEHERPVQLYCQEQRKTIRRGKDEWIP
jgi:histidinol phosphatase-like PHP family hydrolase